MVGVASNPSGPLRLIGYWRFIRPQAAYPGISAEAAEWWDQDRQFGLRLPDPSRLVDPTWNGGERDDLVRYLEAGTLVNQYRGISKCRLCRCDNGSAELTDGTYCWPEGLAHYVREHSVRLPQAVIEHAVPLPTSVKELPRPLFNERGSRDREWPPPEFRRLLWTPPAGTDDGFGFDVEASPDWWLEQTS